MGGNRPTPSYPPSGPQSSGNHRVYRLPHGADNTVSNRAHHHADLRDFWCPCVGRRSGEGAVVEGDAGGEAEGRRLSANLRRHLAWGLTPTPGRRNNHRRRIIEGGDGIH